MTTSPILILAGVLLAAVPAAAQPPVQAVQFAGCWTGADGLDARGRTCVVPDAPATLRLLSIAASGDVTESALRLTGERVAIGSDGCVGWEEARLSVDGERVLVKAEYTCADQPRQVRETAFTITPSGHWMQVTGTGLALITSAQVRVFEPVRMYGEIPASVRTQVMPYLVDAERTRNDLAGRRLSARDLVELDRIGLSTPVLDVLVAASYPKDLVLDARGMVAETPGAEAPRQAATMSDVMSPFYFMSGFPMLSMYDWNALYRCARLATISCQSGLFGYSPYGFGWGGQYLGGYGGFWPGMGYPVVVRPAPVGGNERTSGGRAIRGQGYTQTGGSTSGTARPRGGDVSAPAMNSGGSASARGTGGGSTGSASGSTGGGSSTRTAKPRDP